MLAMAAKMEKRSNKEDRGDSGNVVTWVVLSVAECPSSTSHPRAG